MNNFHELLNQLTVDELKTRLLLIKSKQKPTRKEQIIQFLHDDCLLHHNDYWNKLSELEELVVSEVVHQEPEGLGRQFDAHRFHAKYMDVPEYFVVQSSGYSGEREKKKTSYLKMFFYEGVMADGLCQLMKDYVEKPESTRVKTIDEEALPESVNTLNRQYSENDNEETELPVKIRFMEDVAAHDLVAVLRLIETGKCSVSDKTKRATAATIRKLEEILLDGDYFLPEDEQETGDGSSIRPMRAFAWPLLVQAGGLARRVGKKLELTVKGKKALTAPLQETALLLYQHWRKKGLLDEFSRIDSIKGQGGRGRVMTAVAKRKEIIEITLQHCPVGEWIAVDSLFQYMQASGSELEVCHNEWKLYLADSQYGSLGYSGYHDFEILQGRYILAYFFEYLATLGLLDIAYTVPYLARDDYHGLWGADELIHLSRYDGLLYFRINPLGAYCLGLVDSYQPKVVEKPALLEISADLHLHLLREPEPAENVMLERYAVPVSSDEWQLTESAILKAIENRFSIDEIQQFLQESSDEIEKPEAIQAFFDTAHKRQTALVDMGEARLLRCYSEPFARMLSSDQATRKYCSHAGGLLLVVPDKTKKQFARELLKLGYIYPG